MSLPHFERARIRNKRMERAKEKRERVCHKIDMPHEDPTRSVTYLNKPFKKTGLKSFSLV
jgi:hypothetical protein